MALTTGNHTYGCSGAQVIGSQLTVHGHVTRNKDTACRQYHICLSCRPTCFHVAWDLSSASRVLSYSALLDHRLGCSIVLHVTRCWWTC